jgi:flagellar biosynthetic protein FliQ
MNEQEVIEITRQALFLALQLGAPIMLIGLVVGVIIALIQALTQIQEMTLTFVPKIIAIFFSIFLLFPTFAQLMAQFTEVIADRIVSLG